MTTVRAGRDQAAATGLSWDERYRPRALSDLALSDEHRRLFEGYLAEGIFPHLLLHGPPGVGKTTIARLLLEATDCNQAVFNASMDRGIDVIRGDVDLFLRGHAWNGARWKVAFFDEADGLTREAQDALRNLIEAHPDMGRCIFSANDPAKITRPLWSRCTPVDMGDVPLEERCRVLARVLELEGIGAADHEVRAFAARHADLRGMLLSAQQSMLIHGRLYFEAERNAHVRLISEIISEAGFAETVPWDLEPYVAPGRLTLLCARPKLGKSTFARHYVAKKVLGGEFLGQQLKAGPVLWVTGPEENPQDLGRWFRQLGVGQEQIWVCSGLLDVRAIAAAAAEIDAKLIVLDTLARVAQITSENDNAAWTRWTNEALAVIRESAAAWLAIHHMRKSGGDFGEGMRGASAIFASCDVGLSLRQGAWCNQRKLVVDGTRFESPEHDLVLELRGRDYVVAEHTVHAVAQNHLDDAATVVLLELEKEPEPISRAELARRLVVGGHEVTMPTLYDCLNGLHEAGRVRRHGKGVRGDPHLWEAIGEDSFLSFDTPGAQKKRNESGSDLGAREPSGD